MRRLGTSESAWSRNNLSTIETPLSWKRPVLHNELRPESRLSNMELGRRPITRHQNPTNGTNSGRSTVETNLKPSGFSILLFLHQITGLSYFNCNDYFIINIFSLLFSISFVICYIAMNIPCMFTCVYDIDDMFEDGVSTAFLSFAITNLETLHIISCHIEFIVKGARLRDFFNNCEIMSRFCQSGLDNASMDDGLHVTSCIIVVANLIHMGAEAAILIFYVEHKLIKQYDGNSTESHSTDHDVIVHVDEQIVYYVTLAFKCLGAIHSKAPESLVIFLAVYFTNMIQQYQDRLKVLVKAFNFSAKHDLELERMLLVEIRSATYEMESLFDHFSFIAIFMDISVIFTGVFLVTDGVVRRHEFEPNDYHEMLNISTALIAIYFVCHKVTGVTTQLREVTHTISCINVDKLDNKAFKSYSIIMSMGQLSRSFAAAEAIPLTKKFFFGILLTIFLFVLILTHKAVI